MPAPKPPSCIVTSRVPVLAEVDVLVAGAGSAGCSAALAARRDGRRTVMLIERCGFPGGSSTQVLDTFYGFFTPGGSPLKVVGGIPDRVVDALDAGGGVRLRPNTYGAGTGVTYNPEILKCVWDALLTAAGVRVLMHAFLCDVESSSDGELRGVVLATKRGLLRVRARRFIDATGDADLCHWSGIPYETAGELAPAQTLTTTFRLAGADLERYEAAGGKRVLADRMAEAVDRGTHALPRRGGSAHAMTIPGTISTVATRVANVDPTDPIQLTAAEIEGRRQALEYARFFRDRVPGFENSVLGGLSHQIGVRETRRVHGIYRLTREDCLQGARFADRVLLCGAPIEDHRPAGDGSAEETAWRYLPDGAAYDVPYRTLVPAGRDEVWVAGRCFSATHDAHASCRSMAQTMAMGQAAGTAAALSLDLDCGASSLPVDRLQERLAADGAILETPADAAATGPNDWGTNRRNPGSTNS